MNVNRDIYLRLHNGRVLDAKGAKETKLGRLEKRHGIMRSDGGFL
jgi:hypothetical protein